MVHFAPPISRFLHQFFALSKEGIMTMVIRGCIFLFAVAGTFLSPSKSLGKEHGAETRFGSVGNSNVWVWQNRNAIRGRITDTENRPIERIRVELRDEVEMAVAQTYTDSLGRYAFNSLSLGTFIVKVYSNGKYAEASARVTLTPARIGGGTSHQEILDIPLRTIEEARGKSAPTSKNAIAFVQDVPEPARKAYEKAVGLLEQGKTEEGVEALKDALRLFMNYFMAWERLGVEYVKLQQYEAALLALNQAVKINQSGADSLYALGYTEYQLQHWREAIEALERSLRFAPRSPNAVFAYYYLGLSLLKEKKPAEAEAHLKQACTLGQNTIPADAHWHLAQLYTNAKRYKEAADELEVFLKRTPGNQDSQRIRELIRQLRSKEKGATGTPS